MVERTAVNRLVPGSSPGRGVFVFPIMIEYQNKLIGIFYGFFNSDTFCFTTSN